MNNYFQCISFRAILFNSAAVIICILASCTKTELSVDPSIDFSTITSIKYSDHVQPLLDKKCAVTACHAAATPAAGLSLVSWNSLVKGSQYGEALIAFRPERSLLTRLFNSSTLRKRHPDIGVNTPTRSELEFLQRWISEGAHNDMNETPFQKTTNKLYVPNQGDDNVAVIDTDNLVVTKYISVGSKATIEAPHFIAADSKFWYVSLINTGQIWKFDVATDSLVQIGTVSGFPALLALTPDGSHLYVSQFTTSSMNKVFVLNTATMAVENEIAVWTMPHGIRINHSGTRVYVANMMSDNISVIDAATQQTIATIPLGWDAHPFGPVKYVPMEIAVSPNDSMIAVACSGSKVNEVRFFNTSSYALLDSIRVDKQPWHLQFSGTGEYCYVSNRLGNSVSSIHIPMRHEMDRIISPGTFDFPHGCEISADERYVFISNENTNHSFIPRYNTNFVGNVTVIDRMNNMIVKVLEVGMMPTGISIAR